MPVQEPALRSHNMQEVALGYSFEQAQVEAFRCLQCAKKLYRRLLVKIDIPFYCTYCQGEMEQAIAVVKETTLLPAVCGRVCPGKNNASCFAHWANH